MSLGILLRLLYLTIDKFSTGSSVRPGVHFMKLKHHFWHLKHQFLHFKCQNMGILNAFFGILNTLFFGISNASFKCQNCFMKLPKSEMPFLAFKRLNLAFQMPVFSVYEIDPWCQNKFSCEPYSVQTSMLFMSLTLTCH